jgi:hypothetical protein
MIDGDGQWRFAPLGAATGIDALVLVGTPHPRDFSLADVAVPVTKIVGDKDCIADLVKSERHRPLLPATTRWIVIEGLPDTGPREGPIEETHHAGGLKEGDGKSQRHSHLRPMLRRLESNQRFLRCEEAHEAALGTHDRDELGGREHVRSQPRQHIRPVAALRAQRLLVSILSIRAALGTWLHGISSRIRSTFDPVVDRLDRVYVKPGETLREGAAKHTAPHHRPRARV